MHEHAEISHALIDAFLHALGISLFVFLMMVVVDYFNVLSQGKLTDSFKGGRKRQYFISSFLGSLPGCLGSFLSVTFYLRGMFGFGALVACFVASSGDAAFVMLAIIPDTALPLFGLLFVLGVGYGWLSDILVKRLGISPCAACDQEMHHLAEPDCRIWPRLGVWAHLLRPHPQRLVFLGFMTLATVGVILGLVGPEEWDWIRIAILVLLSAALFVLLTVPDHYLVEHIGHHIARHHLPRIFAWTLGTLLTLAVLTHFVELKEVVSGHMVWVLLLAALIGMIPDSGPHLIFVFLFADGTVPFSVLLTSAIVQDGHGLLPLLSVSVRDSMLVKIFNLGLGLVLGLALFFFGY